MREVFPVREKSGNFKISTESYRKVKKYWVREKLVKIKMKIFFIGQYKKSSFCKYI